MTVFFYSDSVEREESLEDNSVQLQSFVQYEPDLFVSRYVVMQHSLCIFSAVRYLSFFKYPFVFKCFSPFFCAVTLI